MSRGETSECNRKLTLLNSDSKLVTLGGGGKLSDMIPSHLSPLPLLDPTILAPRTSLRSADPTMPMPPEQDTCPLWVFKGSA